LLELSTKLWVDDQIVPLDEEWITRIRDANDQMANNGMRVLGVAVQPIQQEAVANTGILEKELIFIGLVGMIDPPRPEVRDAVSVSRRAGIRPIMITGDHPLTARFIAHDLGITTNNRVKTGRDLDRMNDDEFSEAVSEVSVFARVSPEHKLRIVEQLQKQGQVVAMTGDGVNDSPALKKADIGIAMGITGTDVSKEAASIVLTDDNFATIVAAVEEGRVIFDNIRRFVKFSIAGNLGKVLVMLFAPLLGMQVGLLPLQLLWLNLMTDGLLGLGLGVEPAERDTMKLPPRDPKASFFGRRLNQHMLWVGTLIGLAALWVGALYLDPTDSTNIKWQTMMFTTLAFMQIGQALASRSSTTSFFKQKLGSNPTLVGMIVLVFVLQLVVLYVPALDTFFQIVPLTASDLALSIALGTLPLWAIEIEKWLLRRKQNTH
jgi:Ca2+-transporting ATPase